MNFDLLEFNRVRLVRGKEAARVRCWDDEGSVLLWMSEKDVKNNVLNHGPHFGLVRAAQQYGIHASVVIDWHKATGKTFLAPMEPQRDEYGYWTHPEMIWGEETPDAEVSDWLKYQGLTCSATFLKDDDRPETKDVRARYDSGDTDVLAWQPEPPAAEGWWLVSIHDSEDGVVALWLRKKEADHA